MTRGRFPFQTLTKYPHMKPLDEAVWDRFLVKRPGYFERVDYDVPVGEGAEVDPEHPEEIQYDHTILTQKKIDVVGYVDDTVYVVEVKPVANMRGLGQILTYLELYTKLHPEDLSVRGMVVCGELERELAPMFERHNIIVEIA